MNFSANPDRARKRLRHHLSIALAGFALTGQIYIILNSYYPDPQRWIFRWSLATAYTAAILLAATLTLGAWKVLRGARNLPVSSDLRRDLGIWCAVFSFIHVIFGLNVHLKSWTQYFWNDSGGWRQDAFGFANYLGAWALFIVFVLAAISNDFSLRFFKSSRWKSIQRWNYVFVFFVAAHGFLYQYVEKRLLPFSYIFGAIALWILIFQLAGFLIKLREMRNAQKSPRII